jgi:ParB-like chromosome segregation protein Spo0J
MQVEEWAITSIRPYENNPRLNDSAVDTVAASIKEFGFRQPIVVTEQGIIVVGHTRYKAAPRAKTALLRVDEKTDRGLAVRRGTTAALRQQ